MSSSVYWKSHFYKVPKKHVHVYLVRLYRKGGKELDILMGSKRDEGRIEGGYLKAGKEGKGGKKEEGGKDCLYNY